MTTQPPFFARLARREKRGGDRLPYLRALNDHTVLMEGGMLMQTLQVEGFGFETADTDDLNHRHALRDIMLRGISNSRLALYHHVIRRQVQPQMPAQFDNPTCTTLNDDWMDRLSTRRLFVNDLFLTLVYRPATGKVGVLDWIGDIFKSPGRGTAKADMISALRTLDSARQSLMASLSGYAPRLLGSYTTPAGTCSEVLEFLSCLYNGEMAPVLASTARLGDYIPYKRVSFGLNALERRGTKQNFSAILSIKEYPAATTPGMLDGLLRLPCEFVLSESFAFVERQIAQERIDLSLRRFRAADDDTTSLRRGLIEAKDDVTAGRAGFGEHHMTMCVTADSLDALDAALAETQAALSDIGAIAVREDLNMEPAFWAQFPGNFGYIARKSMISTGNFAGLGSLHNFPLGQMSGNHWGPAITVLETTSGTPYFFNFHRGDLGNFLLIGPSGTGKTVILGFLLAQAQKLKPRTIFFDKDRGAEIFIRAIGGRYEVLRPGEPTAMNPLQLADTAANRVFLRSWIAQLLMAKGAPLTAEDDAVIAEAIDGNFDQEPQFRRLRYFRELLAGMRRPSAGDLASRLAPWCARGEYAWAFDNDQDGLAADAPTLGFDMTAILDVPALRTPVMMYLFHRVEERLDGNPTIVVIDEGWKALDDAVFVARLRDWMKTIRKRNGIVGFCTQSASDALESRISSAIIEQSACQMFMANPRAQEADYCGGFGLTPHELALVRALPENAHCFLIKTGSHSIVARLDLSGMDDALMILSGRESSVRALDDIRARVGDAPERWLPVLLGKPEALRSGVALKVVK